MEIEENALILLFSIGGISMKNEIIAVTKKLIRRNGMKFTISSIAKELGISTKTIYKHFVNKEEIIETIIRNFKDESDKAQVELLQQKLPYIDKLKLLLTRLPNDYDLISNRSITYVKMNYPRVYEMIMNIYRDDWDRFTGLYTSGVEEGVLKEIDYTVFKEMYISSITNLPLVDSLSSYSHFELLERIVSQLLFSVEK